MEEYPKREAFFSQKVIRRMVKTCAAQDIGPNATLLVAVIAACEDVKRYTGPVSYYNEQLMPILGIRKWDTLNRARQRAVDAGWLIYLPPPSGTKGIAPKYWTDIPARYVDLDDSPIDEGPYPKIGYDTPKADTEPEKASPKKVYVEGDDRVYVQGDVGGEPSLPNPNPNPNPKEKSAKTPDQELLEWCEWWNGLHASGHVQAAVRLPNVSEGVKAAWRRYGRSKALRETLADREAVAQQIRQSPFVKAGWFTLPKLFGGKNQDGEVIAEKLMNGGYQDNGRQRIKTGPGQRHRETDYGKTGLF